MDFSFKRFIFASLNNSLNMIKLNDNLTKRINPLKFPKIFDGKTSVIKIGLRYTIEHDELNNEWEVKRFDAVDNDDYPEFIQTFGTFEAAVDFANAIHQDEVLSLMTALGKEDMLKD